MLVSRGDCVAYAAADFQCRNCLKGQGARDCLPEKLDDGKDIYREKITAIIDHAQINTLTVAHDAGALLPRGLLAHRTARPSRPHKRKVPLKAVIVSIDGGKRCSREEWV